MPAFLNCSGGDRIYVATAYTVYAYANTATSQRLMGPRLRRSSCPRQRSRGIIPSAARRSSTCLVLEGDELHGAIDDFSDRPGLSGASPAPSMIRRKLSWLAASTDMTLSCRSLIARSHTDQRAGGTKAAHTLPTDAVPGRSHRQGGRRKARTPDTGRRGVNRPSRTHCYFGGGDGSPFAQVDPQAHQ